MTVKQGNQEIGELWEIGKRLWRRDFAAVYELANNPSWPSHLQPIVLGLVGEDGGSNNCCLLVSFFVASPLSYSFLSLLPLLCSSQSFNSFFVAPEVKSYLIIHFIFLASLPLVKLRERVLVLVGKSYTTIRVPDLCALLGQSESDVRQSKCTIRNTANYY